MIEDKEPTPEQARKIFLLKNRIFGFPFRPWIVICLLMLVTLNKGVLYYLSACFGWLVIIAVWKFISGIFCASSNMAKYRAGVAAILSEDKSNQ